MATAVTGTRRSGQRTRRRKAARDAGRAATVHKRNGDGLRFLRSSSRPQADIALGTWVAMASILMLFTALSSAYIVRAASSSDWQPLAMPRILLLSSVLLHQ